ncbi:hypothetical protein [Streptomyces sp. NPDC051921]|uniref:hypothetical protein n=1 Tax=Streptomyces sp. NPDC051921 TaxID=3155806 RepID=UPI00343812B1
MRRTRLPLPRERRERLLGAPLAHRRPRPRRPHLVLRPVVALGRPERSIGSSSAPAPGSDAPTRTRVGATSAYGRHARTGGTARTGGFSAYGRHRATFDSAFLYGRPGRLPGLGRLLRQKVRLGGIGPLEDRRGRIARALRPAVTVAAAAVAPRSRGDLRG